MQEEIFEVVDENNKVIGREKRSAVHEKGMGHRAVYVLLFNSKNELLLQKRTVSKKVAPWVREYLPGFLEKKNSA